MKFSWTFLNYLINLESINFEKFQNELILNGFEIDNIEKNILTKDLIIDLSITSNRPDVLNNIGLAREISSIFNIPLKIPFIKNKNLILNINHETNSKIIDYFILNPIVHLQKSTVPLWLNNYITTYQSKTIQINVLNTIQKYIKMKWGYNLYFLETKKINDNIIKYSHIKLNDNTLNDTINITYKNQLLATIKPDDDQTVFSNISNTPKSIILFLPLFNSRFTKYDQLDYFLNTYYDTISMLSTLTKCTIGKSYQYYSNTSLNRVKLKLYKSHINNILGPINNGTSSSLTKTQITQILQQLNLQPNYSKKHFNLNVPIYRKHDLKRKIDIIEEIGRIHGFEQFEDKLPFKKRLGRSNNHRLSITKIRKILNNLGLNEVINGSLIKNSINRSLIKNIKIYNHMLEDHRMLRSNLIDNIIQNYIINIRNKKHVIELFEIGKVFYCYANSQKERLHLAGILYNQDFNRKTWQNNNNNLNWFQAKGILETFLEKLNIHIAWKKIKNIVGVNHITKSFHSTNILGIYDIYNKKLIGIFGEINKNFCLEKNIPNAYIFEINLLQLIDNLQKKKHVNYITKSYSNYPSVTKDISIKLNKEYKLDNIKQIISKNYTELIESISIISIYNNKSINLYSLCLRITYRASNRTLSNQDIKNINHHIAYILNQLA